MELKSVIRYISKQLKYTFKDTKDWYCLTATLEYLKQVERYQQLNKNIEKEYAECIADYCSAEGEQYSDLARELHDRIWHIGTAYLGKSPADIMADIKVDK